MCFPRCKIIAKIEYFVLPQYFGSSIKLLLYLNNNYINIYFLISIVALYLIELFIFLPSSSNLLKCIVKMGGGIMISSFFIAYKKINIIKYILPTLATLLQCSHLYSQAIFSFSKYCFRHFSKFLYLLMDTLKSIKGS